MPVSTTAGLLAVAVFGLVMSHAFDRELGSRCGPGHPAALRVQMSDSARAGRDGDARERTPGTAMLKEAVADSFVAGFRRVMLISAVLALLSAACAALTPGARVKRTWRWDATPGLAASLTVTMRGRGNRTRVAPCRGSRR
jgi:hypothetical protein